MATKPGKKSKPTRLSDLAAHLVLPDGIVTTGWPAVRDRCAQWGIAFDPWQDGLGRAMLAKRSDGKYAAGVGGVCMSLPRQVGKTFTVGNMVFGLALTTPNLKVLWSAHRTRTSAETFKVMQGIAREKEVAPSINHVRRANGQEEIEFANGSRILFGARESGFGRGFDKVDILVFDEAQILTQKPIDDMIAATNAAPNGLVIYLGTPPKPSDPCEVFTRIRTEALEGGDGETLYVEFSAPGKHAIDDEREWAAANPSYPARTSHVAMRRLLKNLGEDSFRREGLGVWDTQTALTPAIPPSVWEATCASETDLAKRDKTAHFAVRFSADGAWVALAAASRLDDGRVFVDAVRMEEAAAGTAWLIQWLCEPDRLERTGRIIVEGKSGAAYLIDQLRASGITGRVLVAPRTQDAIDAHSLMLARLTEQSLCHLPHSELDRQASLAQRRTIGTQGGFGWKAPDGDTCCLLDAVTLAAWSVTKNKNVKRTATPHRKKVIVL